MSEQFLGEIRIAAFNFAPKGWSQCNGQTLSINQNAALFALMGTMYGGNGQTFFLLPNLQGRVTIGFSGTHTQGSAAGEAGHILTMAELPSHTHTAVASNAVGDSISATGKIWANDSNLNAVFGTTPNALLSPTAIAQAGGGQPHQNEMPYLTVNFIVALVGIFPSRN